MSDELDFVIINIGRNHNGQPLSKENWLEFQRLIKVQVSGQFIGYATGTSEYNGNKESFATFHALVRPSMHDLNRSVLTHLARFYGQESIAYVISTPDSLVYAAQPLDTYL